MAFDWSQRGDIPLIYRDPADIRLLNRAAITGEEINPLEHKLTNPAKLPDVIAYSAAIAGAKEFNMGMIVQRQSVFDTDDSLISTHVSRREEGV